MSIRSEQIRASDLDWLTILIYFLLVLIGWLSIFASVYDVEIPKDIFDLSTNSGKQFLWIIFSIFLVIPVMVIDFKVYESFAYIFYIIMMVVMVGVFFMGNEIRGAKTWINLGFFRIQPLEFAKLSTVLAVSKYLSSYNVKIIQSKVQLILALLVILPFGLTILQGDTGSALVFTGFILVFYREGISQTVLIITFALIVVFVMTLLIPLYYMLSLFGVMVVLIILLFRRNRKLITFTLISLLFTCLIVFGINYAVKNILMPHQQKRIYSLVNPNVDPLGIGWNVTQSKIAIGSGGFLGKGFLEGTQTKFDFVPEQSTDFIFCTIGEEKGMLGTTFVVLLFMALLYRIVIIAERQKSNFSRIFAYSTGSILFIHFVINIGMTIGLVPVIGIPLPFISYGGSSFLGFTLLLFILLKLDAHQAYILR